MSLFLAESEDVKVFNGDGLQVNAMNRMSLKLCGEFNNVEYFYIEADHGLHEDLGLAKHARVKLDEHEVKYDV